MENDGETIIFGEHIVGERKVVWYGDSDYLYIYSNTTKQVLVWTKELLDLNQIVGEVTETKKFNSCLLKLYQNGNEGIA